MGHYREGKEAYAESILDYARTKLSRSSYFKLKREIAVAIKEMKEEVEGS